MAASITRKTPVALIGLGGVGASVLSQLLSPALSSKFNLILIANSRSSLSLPLPNSSPEFSLTTENWKPLLEQHGKPLDIPSIISLLSTHPEGPCIFIDSTGSSTIPELYPTILQMNVNLVTPNKKGFSSSQSLYDQIQNSSYPKTTALVYGESTVGAGLPILSTLKDLVGTGDEINKVEGVFSGTLSYIFN